MSQFVLCSSEVSCGARSSSQQVRHSSCCHFIDISVDVVGVSYQSTRCLLRWLLQLLLQFLYCAICLLHGLLSCCSQYPYYTIPLLFLSHILFVLFEANIESWYLNQNIRRYSIMTIIQGIPIYFKKLTHSNQRKVEECFEKWLRSWKGNHLFIGTRLTLINLVLRSLPMYMIYFFKISKQVLKMDYFQSNLLARGQTYGKNIGLLCGLYLVSLKIKVIQGFMIQEPKILLYLVNGLLSLFLHMRLGNN